MKTFVITMLFLTIFTSCSQNNAFSSFQMTQEQAKSEDSIQSSKIFNKTETNGIISAIYLNRVLPQEYNGKEYFYIYLYTKDDAKDMKFILNDNEALHTEELKSKNKFSHLTSFSGDWQKYYLVSFESQGEFLNLVAKNSKSKSNKMKFQKDN